MKIIILLILISILMGGLWFFLKDDQLRFGIYSTDNLELIRVTESGEITMRDQVVGTLGADGAVLDTAGKRILVINDDGTVLLHNTPIAKIFDDGTIEMESGQVFAWNSAGSLVLSESNQLRIEPNNTALFKQASLLFTMYATWSATEAGTVQSTNSATMNDIENDASAQSNQNELPQISRIIFGQVTASNLGGSADIQGPAIRQYSDYDAFAEANAETKSEFYNVLEEYLDGTVVNGSVTLRDYLTLQYHNDEAQLKEIHQKRPVQPKGTAVTFLPILLFHGGLAEPSFVLMPDDVELKGIGASKLEQFLAKHAHNFSDEYDTEDSFYKQYYINALDLLLQNR